MGGIWERMIGMIRKILDFMLFEFRFKFFIYEIFVIFLCEVCVIINLCLVVLIFIDLMMFMIFSLFMFLIGKVDFLFVVFDFLNFLDIY